MAKLQPRGLYLLAYYCSSISILFCSYSRAISNKKVLPYCAQLFRTSRENIRKHNGQNFGGIWLYSTSTRSFLQLFTSECTSMHIRLAECTCDFVCSDQTNWIETNKLSARSRSPLSCSSVSSSLSSSSSTIDKLLKKTGCQTGLGGNYLRLLWQLFCELFCPNYFPWHWGAF